MFDKVLKEIGFTQVTNYYWIDSRSIEIEMIECVIGTSDEKHIFPALKIGRAHKLFRTPEELRDFMVGLRKLINTKL